MPALEAFCFKETALREATQNYCGQAAEAVCGRTSEAACRKTAVCAIINARRGQVYGMIEGFMEPGPYMLTDVIEVYKSKMEPDGWKLLFFGDGVDAYEKDIIGALGEPGPGPEAHFEFAPESDRYQDAVSVGRWAVERIRQCGGIDGCTVDFENLLPDYMRRAEAEQKLESGELPICRGPKQE